MADAGLALIGQKPRYFLFDLGQHFFIIQYSKLQGLVCKFERFSSKTHTHYPAYIFLLSHFQKSSFLNRFHLVTEACKRLVKHKMVQACNRLLTSL